MSEPGTGQEFPKCEAVLSSIADAISIRDLAFRVVYENEAHVRLKGKHVGELCYKAYHHRDDVCEGCPVAMTFSDGLVHNAERTFEVDGDKRILEITSSPLKNARGNIIAGIEVVRDITEKKKTEASLKDSHRLLSSMSAIYSAFFASTDYRAAFDNLLTSLLELTGSEYGFIGEVLYTAEGKPYLKTHAITNISWDEETRALYSSCSESGFEFYNLETIFGETLKTGRPYISNNPSADPKRSGLPEGHPPLNSFLGMPFCKGDSMLGMVGIANRPGGYEQGVIDYLDAYLKTCTNIIDSYRNENQRKRAEAGLQVSERYYKELFESSPISLWEEDFSDIKKYIDMKKGAGVADWRAYLEENPQEVMYCASLVKIVNVNNATVKLYKAGRKKELLEGLHKVFTNSSVGAFVNGLVALAEGKTSFESEAVNKTLEGDELKLYMKWSILPGFKEDWSKVLVAMNDLTALRHAEEYLKRILETVDEGFIVIDRDLRIIAANRAYADRLKTTEDELRGKKCYEVSHKKTRPCFEEGEDCPVAKTFRTGNPHTATHIHEDAEGNTYYAELKSYPLKDQAGSVISTIETVVDVSEKVKLQEELVKSQKLESVGLLAGGIAHDFNNLLLGVFGYISLAKLTAGEAAKADLEEAEKALSRAKGLTQQLLTFSRGGEPMKRTLNLLPLVKNAVAFALSGAHVQYQSAITHGLRHVNADEGQITQVIHNIVINAAEAMPGGGTISLRAENVRVKSNAHTILGEGDYVRITIEDTGVGIPQEYLQKIFDPYFTTKKRGSGLGLTTTYSIIRKHGGHIEVESRPGCGSKFVIYLPASKEEAVEAETGRMGLVHGRGRILVMDDDDTVRMVCHKMLSEMGYEADFAEDGEETFRKYAAAREAGRPFDAAILDLTIRGGLGGRETMQRLLAIDPDVRAIVSSGYAEDPIVAKFRTYGFKAALSKPYRIEEMSEVLHDLLDGNT